MLEKKDYFLYIELQKIYGTLLNNSIKDFDYITEVCSYSELDNLKLKKIFPRTHLIKINKNTVKLSINKNVTTNINLYVEELEFILKEFIVHSYENNQNFESELDYINFLYKNFDEDWLTYVPFIKLKLNNSSDFKFLKDVDINFKILNLKELENLEIFLTGVDEYCIDIFFKNFSYFQPKNSIELNWNDENNILPLLNLCCE